MQNKSESFEKEFKIIYKALFSKGMDSNKTNLDKTIIITFAGIPGSGKTTISTEIQKQYGGIIINLDNVMDIISKNKLVKTTEQSEQMKKIFVYSILKKPELKNKLIILDASLDREYKRFLKNCKENKWDYFIVQLKLSKEEALERFKRRNSDNLENWLPRLDRWLKDHGQFKKDVKSNILLDGVNPDMKSLFKELDKII